MRRASPYTVAAMSGSKAAIVVSHLSKTYRVPSLAPWKPAGLKQALIDVSFRCPEGRITCLLGPNGSGKTTIIKILAGLIEADGGDASVAGVPLPKGVKTLRSNVGLASSSERSFYWRLTGRQNLEFFASLHSLKGARRTRAVVEALEMTAMSDHADKPVRLYSSGMRQRLVFARALLGEPRVLLLDEPTTHLDYGSRQSIHRLIKEELTGKRGISALVCTNDLHEAQDLADSLALLDRGTILSEGPLDALRAHLGGRLRLVLSFELLPAPGWERTLGITLLPKGETTLSCSIPSRALIPDIVRAAVLAGGRVAACTCAEPELPEIFERMTGGGE
jgi:ABC-2 type transport system ATP-binding protein